VFLSLTFNLYLLGENDNEQKVVYSTMPGRCRQDGKQSKGIRLRFDEDIGGQMVRYENSRRQAGRGKLPEAPDQVLGLIKAPIRPIFVFCEAGIDRELATLKLMLRSSQRRVGPPSGNTALFLNCRRFRRRPEKEKKKNPTF
jgi:hypothetical protein